MKYKLMLLLFISNIYFSETKAQHIRFRINFPININIGSRGPAPFQGAVWIGPEWMWRGGRYECTPGYWAHPIHEGARWVPGRWKRERRGHVWISGYWR